MDPSPPEEAVLPRLMAGPDTAIELDSGHSARLSFRPSPDGEYEITASGYAPFQLEVRDSRGQILASGHAIPGRSLFVEWHSPSGDPVEIALSGTDSTGWNRVHLGLHRIRYADPYENDDQPERAHVLPPDGTTQLRTLLPGDVDWVRIPAPAGRHVRVVARTRPRETGQDVRFHDPDSSAPAYGFYPTVLSLTASEDGFARIRVTDDNPDSTSWYDLHAFVDTASEDDFEPDDHPDRARPVAIDALPSLRILAPFERDWFRFETEGGARYRILVENRSRDLRDLGFSVHTDPRGPSVGVGCARPESKSWVYLQPSTSGTTWIQVMATWPSPAGDYSLSVLRLPLPYVPDAFESDDRLSDARPLEVDGLPQERSLPRNDVDWVRLEVDSGRTYTLREPYNRKNLVFQPFRQDSTPIAPPSLTSLRVEADRSGPIFVRIQQERLQLSVGYVLEASLEPKSPPSGDRPAGASGATAEP